MLQQPREILRKIKNENLSIAVAVEGGGLRGIVSLAMLSVLRDLSLDRNVKVLAGTSSGAINAAYFLADQIEDCLALYRKMASANFIQPWRWPNAMNLDYLFKDQIIHHHPLYWQKVLESQIDFHITVTPTLTGQTISLKAKDLHDQETLIKALRASASAPLYTTNKESLFGQEYNDGHVQWAIPYPPLLQKKVDLILCFQTQRVGYRKKESIFSVIHQKLSLRNYNNNYKKAFAQSGERYNKQLDEITSNDKLVALQVPSNSFLISKMSRNPTDVDQCFRETKGAFL